MTSNERLNQWIYKMAKLTQPDSIHLCDGSEKSYETYLEDMVKSKMAIPLNSEKRPGCYAFFSDPSDVARIEERTFIASYHKDDAGPLNHWIDPIELSRTMIELYKGSMVGRIMYVIPFIMGPKDSDLSKIGVQLTDSLYVVAHMHLMTRMGKVALDLLGKNGQFIECLHSVGYPLNQQKVDVSWPCAPVKQKFIAHFPEQLKIWSYGSGYGGNALLGKKCLALRIASYMAKNEGWLAEHMLILKITNPIGQYKYFAAAFPSACGKTNLAMMMPSLKDWKIETIGDDIAWMKFREDGKLYAINPEKGFFGVARGTSMTSNPVAYEMIKSKTLFTNVALTDDLDVWWKDCGILPPDHLTDWRGNHWFDGSPLEPNHPNSRFTVAIDHLPSKANEWDDPKGVEISAIIFGGRRKSLMPLVYESMDWAHGVFMGSIMGSEITTAMLSDRIGEVRRDPFAMRPFIGYHIGDYLSHWLSMEHKTDSKNLPKIFSVNWFKKDANDAFLWPGFKENSRVLKWMFERIDHKIDAELKPIGYMPFLDGIDCRGLDLKVDQIKQLLEVDHEAWLQEIKDIEMFYQSIGNKCPKALYHQLDLLKSRMIVDAQNAYQIENYLSTEHINVLKKI